MGYVVEGVEQEGEAGGAEAEPPIAAFLATASAARGEAQFQKCAACHTVTPGGANGIGPNIYGVLGKAHGPLPNFQYSDALKSVPGNWEWDSLSAWLKSPQSSANGRAAGEERVFLYEEISVVTVSVTKKKKHNR